MTIETQARHASLAIAKLLGTYRQKTPDDAFDVDALAGKVHVAVTQNMPVQLVLPAFAFKSPNRKVKTLGVLPDKAEEMALAHLQGLADNVERIHAPGAVIDIVSDGLVYSDVLGISDENVFAYGEALRAMATRIGAHSIRFVRIAELLQHQVVAATAKEYAASVALVRQELLSRYGGGEQVDVGQCGDVQRTYRTYQSVLKDDLAHLDESKREAACHAMLQRGKAFAGLIADKVASAHVRLSIHPSDNVQKLSIELMVNTTYKQAPSAQVINPWHGCIVLHADGSWQLTHRSTVDDQDKYTVSHKDGQPWLLREKAEVFEWQHDGLVFEPLYPCGMLVSPSSSSLPPFEEVDMAKVRTLALGAAPLLFRGFSMHVAKETFRTKAQQLGEVYVWPFGDILEVRENAAINMNNVLTNEAMPFHYDGVFVTVEDDDGIVSSTPPLFQMFRNCTSKMRGGLTLFSSSRNLIPLLSADDDTALSTLRNTVWETFTPSNDAFGGDLLRLPLFISHPVTGQLTFRFHEPWPASKTANCQPTHVKLLDYTEEKSEDVCAKLTELLYDRRTCYYHAWNEGDLLFNDNMTTHHTRTAFGGGHREHWRVHVN